MGFVSLRNIGSAFKSIGNIVKPLATQALKSIAGPAVDMLKNVVGSGFDAAVKVAQSYTSRLPVIGDLASKLLGKGAEALKGMAFNGLDNLVKGLVGQPQTTNVGGQNVTTPPLAQRATAAVSTASSAATAALNNATAAAGGSLPKSIADNLAFSPGLSSAQSKMLNDATAAGMDPKQVAQLKIQMEMDNMKQTMEMFSNIMKTMSGISNTIVGNMRG